MGTAATELVIAGQVVTVAGEYGDVKATCAARKLTADDGVRAMRTVDGDEVTFNIAAVAMIRTAAVKVDRGAFGFARALEA